MVAWQLMFFCISHYTIFLWWQSSFILNAIPKQRNVSIWQDNVSRVTHNIGWVELYWYQANISHYTMSMVAWLYDLGFILWACLLPCIYSWANWLVLFHLVYAVAISQYDVQLNCGTLMWGASLWNRVWLYWMVDQFTRAISQYDNCLRA